MTVFIDTNVLLYAVGSKETEAEKKRQARILLIRDDICFSIQVLNEFIWQSTRPNKGTMLSEDRALEYVASWRRFPLQELTVAVFDEALGIFQRDKFSYWDAMIVAAARAQGCDILYSEDMQDGRIIDGMRIINPFR